MTDSKQGILLIEEDNNLRSYYSTALNNTGKFALFVTANGKEALQIIEGHNLGEINYVLLNANMHDIPFYVLIQKIRDHKNTFQSCMYLFSNEISEEDKFILKEMYIKDVLPQKIEAIKLIDIMNANLKSRSNSLFNKQIQELEYNLKMENLETCELLISDEKFKLFLENSSETIHHLGDYYLLRKEIDKCYHLLNNYIQEKGNEIDLTESMSILNCFGKCLCLAGKFKEASLIYKRLSDRSPKNLDHKINLSTAFIGNADWKNSENALKSILEMDPTNQKALMNSVQNKVALKNEKEAKCLLEKITGTIEHNSIASFFNNRGIASMHDNEFDNAESFYKNALFFTKKDVGKILFNLGLCLHKNNKNKEAKQIFEKIKDTPDYEYLSQSKDLLKKISHLK
jgi:Tfp pilus assembly protein PilF/DNA-binding response OmpR family regulator